VDSTILRYRCNICGQGNEVPQAEFHREKPSCSKCGSSVRLRALALLIAEELAGAPLALPDLPTLRGLEGIGMSDPDPLAEALEPRFRYSNTFYHKAPLFDVLHPEPGRTYDFIISSEVLEHVPAPVDRAFRNLAASLNDDGVLLLTTPYSLADQSTEHFGNLRDFAVVELAGGWVLVNRREDGSVETFTDLVFHGGEGATLEMRVFTEAALRSLLQDAGFTHIRIAGGNHPQFGIYQSDPWSLPIAARKTPPPPRPLFEELAASYGATKVKLNNAERDLKVLKQEYERHATWAEEKVGQLEGDLKQRTAWGQKTEQEFEERTAWAMQLRDELEQTKQDLAAQETEVEKRTHWALALQAELDQERAERQRLESTRGARLSRKFRLFR
jgi:SAM-dependent methyltransferase